METRVLQGRDDCIRQYREFFLKQNCRNKYRGLSWKRKNILYTHERKYYYNAFLERYYTSGQENRGNIMEESSLVPSRI